MKRCRGLLTYIFARPDGGNSDGRCRRPARPLPYVGPKRRPPSSYRRTKGRQRRPRRQPAEHLLRHTSPRLRFIGRPKRGRAGRARSLHLRPVRRSAIEIEDALSRGGEIPFGRQGISLSSVRQTSAVSVRSRTAGQSVADDPEPNGTHGTKWNRSCETHPAKQIFRSVS